MYVGFIEAALCGGEMSNPFPLLGGELYLNTSPIESLITTGCQYIYVFGICLCPWELFIPPDTRHPGFAV